MSFKVGLYDATAVIETAPAEAAQGLSSKKANGGGGLTKQDLAELLLDLNASSLCLSGCAFADEVAIDSFVDCVKQSMNLTELSFKDMPAAPPFAAASVCADALVENLSVQKVCLSGCSLASADATKLAEGVLPWNRTIIDWDLSGNPELGDSGVNAIVDALIAATSSVQHLNLRGTGISDVAAVAKKLEQLTCLYQVDLADAGSQLTVPQATNLHASLLNNAALLRPHVKRELVPLVEGAGDGSEPEQPAEPAAAPTEAAPEQESEKPAEKPAAASPARKRAVSTRQRGQSVKPRDPAPASGSPQPARARAQSRYGSPAPASGTSSPRQRGRSVKDPNSPPPQRAAPAPAAAEQQPKEEQRQPEAAPADDQSKAAAPAQDSGSPAPQRQSRPKPQPLAPPAPSSTRGRSPTRSPARSSSAAHTRVRHMEVDEGADEWRRKRNEYNQFIRGGSPANSRSGSPSVREVRKPKFVLGKRVDDAPQPSAVFKTSPSRARERAPTPSEVRRMAPWNQRQAEGHVAVGQVTRVVVEDADGAAPATVVTFVDGGKQTYIEDDPRDIGYQARRIQTGQVKATGSLYRSNTARDMRFGLTPQHSGFVQPQAQAPGPGAYYPKESEWEKRARTLRERARTQAGTGRALFGSSAAPRPTAQVVKDYDRPGPGEYEIP